MLLTRRRLVQTAATSALAAPFVQTALAYNLPVTNKIYSIEVKHSGKVLAVADASLEQGHRVIQWQYNRDNNEQRWLPVALGNEIYEFRVLHSGQVIAVAEASKDNGVKVIQWPRKQNGPEQQFRVEHWSGDFFYIRPVHSNKFLGISNRSIYDGADLIQWDNSGGDEQRFKFNRV